MTSTTAWGIINHMSPLEPQIRKIFFPTAVKGTFRSRPNRFIVECSLGGKSVRAYLPNPGRLWELFFPGSILYLVKHKAGYKGKMAYTVVGVERKGIPIMLHTHVNNLVAAQLIKENRIPGLEDSEIVRSEVTIGNSRFDFLLKKEKEPIVVEVKSCTLVGNSIAMFPDAVTKRGTKHLRELADISKGGMKTAVIFLVQYPNVLWFMPDYHTDLDFSQTLALVKDRVMIRAVSVEWKEWLLHGDTKELSIPWHLIYQEAQDSGCYIIILRLKNDSRILIGRLGEVRFKRGYYLYVGSARSNLSQRIERHKRLIKRHHWNIDELRSAAEFHAALPIRASENLECEISGALSRIAVWNVKGFGSSDCDCESHLLWMAEDPLKTRPFINLLHYFRIDRLGKYLNHDIMEKMA
jgi:sugar fermentation stimulation protein A